MSRSEVINSSPSEAGALAGLFDVAISFTARDPAATDLANELADALRNRGLRTFHFRSIEEAAQVLGERLSETLPTIYRQRALVAVLIASPSYGQTHWTRVELNAALSRPRDDDGQPRLVSVSADGTRIADLPEDVIHLGERVDSADLRDVVNLLAQRCGKRRPWLDRLWPPVALVGGCGLAGWAWWVAGVRDSLNPWAATVAVLAMLLALAAMLVPRLWLAQRRRAAAGRLGVITEGSRLLTFRRLVRWLGLSWAVSFLGLATLLATDTFDARLRVRDIHTLLGEGSVAAAVDRFASERTRLADFEPDLDQAFRDTLAQRLDGGHWLEFPLAYERFRRLNQAPMPELEAAFWQASGAEALWPGADIQDHVDVAYGLAPAAPDLADRLFQTALARRLEWVMSGNDFFYGHEGVRAWQTYRTLLRAVGRRPWLERNLQNVLPNNSGLSVRIAVGLMLEGDVTAEARVSELLTADELDGDLLEELADTPVPAAAAELFEPKLVAAWQRLHATDRPTPEGFELAVALATNGSDRVEDFLIERARDAKQMQEQAHAVHGLAFRVIKGLVRRVDDVAVLLDAAVGSSDALVRHALTIEISGEADCDPRFAPIWGARLRAIMEIAPTEGPATNTELQEEARTRVAAYQALCGAKIDANLIQQVEAAFALDPGGNAPLSFNALREAYEELGPPPGSADMAIEHVRLLGAMGRTGDPAAQAFLEERFDTLAHGNMRIAAAESLLALTGRLGERMLTELQELANMGSSIYRRQVIEMLLRAFPAIDQGDPSERTRIVSILGQINVTGDAGERGLLLDALRKFDPELARRRALSLTFASQRDDQLEGIERLWVLWQDDRGATKQGLGNP